MPVQIPDGVEINITDNIVSVKGSKGSLSQEISKDIKIDFIEKERQLNVSPATDDKELWGMWGLYRVLINNMVIGVTSGFKKVLEIQGIGYKVEKKGSNLLISAGHSHPVLFLATEGISLDTEGLTRIIVSGIDKQRVGQVAAEIRSLRPPEPYKGKGIRYEGEYIRRKAGKTGAV
jgi:large subunit ribosomal protein L6